MVFSCAQEKVPLMVNIKHNHAIMAKVQFLHSKPINGN
jgi:hypothetical protein